ncbi:MAG TPA: signal peptide peptidase SppA [Polyangiaceae bacterium]
MLGLLIRFAWLIGWLVALPWLALRRFLGRTRAGTYVLVEIDGAVEEILPPRRWWPPQRAHATSLHELRELVDAVVADPRVRGLVLTVKALHAGFATGTSMRALITRARAAGKRVVVHLPQGGGTRETYTAVAADEVLLGPTAGLAPVGLLTSARYLRGALDRAGLVPEVHAQGRYKTAGERIERTTMSDAEREQVGAVLDRVHGEVVRAITEGRRVDAARARALVDGAPYSGAEAVSAGLADGTAYEDELPARLAEGDEKPPLRHAEGYLHARTAFQARALRSRGVIAVVRVHGTIAGGSGGLPFRSMAVDERIISAVRIARASPRVRGVVLHVDSPGGGALASDRIHHELVQLAAEKPLVACMGNVAASGGYYVAAPAHAIVAQPTTITGSIGVIAARVVLDPLLARLGVATEVLQRGAHARLLDPFLPLEGADRAALDRELEHIYRAFVAVVAAGRRRPVGEIEPLAQGRVWTGADAHAHGLVDRLGGFEDALDVVRERIGRGADRLRVAVVRAPRKPFPVLDPPERKAARLFSDGLSLALAALDLDASVLALRGERVLAFAASLPTFR